MNKIVKYFEKPNVGKAVRYIFYASLVLLLISEFFVEKHVYFSWAAFPAFNAVFGFLSCVVIIVVAKLLGKLWLQKGEDYYD